jgi:hypothetical protein
MTFTQSDIFGRHLERSANIPTTLPKHVDQPLPSHFGAKYSTHLHTAANGHPQAEVHLVLGCHKDSSDVLACIASNGQHDETQEAAAQVPGTADLQQ